MDAQRIARALIVAGSVGLSFPAPVWCQERVGVVTNVEGTALVARVTTSEPQPLRFKDDIFLRDRVTTGERSFVRVLLGGKATVTARERSVLTITEVPGVATVHLDEGRISVAVSKGLMKPGESIEIKTPNAVTAIRGTVVVAEVFPSERGVESTITLLRGLIDVTRLDPLTHRRVGSAIPMRPLHSLTVTASSPLTAPRSITLETARRLNAEFSFIPGSAPAQSAAPAVRHAVGQAAVDAEAFRAATARAKSSGEFAGNNGGASSGKEKIGTDGITLAPVAVKGLTPVPTLESSASIALPLKSSRK
jgi:FecR protein